MSRLVSMTSLSDLDKAGAPMSMQSSSKSSSWSNRNTGVISRSCQPGSLSQQNPGSSSEGVLRSLSLSSVSPQHCITGRTGLRRRSHTCTHTNTHTHTHVVEDYFPSVGFPEPLLRNKHKVLMETHKHTD